MDVLRANTVMRNQLINKTIFCILYVLLGGCGSSNWTATDTKYEVAFQTINALDAYSTAQIRHDPALEERAWPTRQLIGSNPAEDEVALLFVTYGISHYLIARALPPKWRRYYQISTMGYSIALVINNCQLGLCD